MFYLQACEEGKEDVVHKSSEYCPMVIMGRGWEDMVHKTTV